MSEVFSESITRYRRSVSPAELLSLLRTIVPELPDTAEADIVPFDADGRVIPNLSGPRLDLPSCGLMLKWSVSGVS